MDKRHGSKAIGYGKANADMGEQVVAFSSGISCWFSVTPSGVVTGWLLEALLSTRAGQPQLSQPAPYTHANRAERPTPPVGP